MVGRSIGNYQVVSLLGEGGMGRVYLAHHPGIGRRSAIKVLRPDLTGDPAAVSRFLDEARASNAIRHPNIVEIFDSGLLEDGAPYIIMEHLEGQTLAGRMAKGLPLGEALDFASQAASALAAAHAQQIVHRDLKPENLFVIRDPRAASRELIKVLDFGVAKLQEGREEPAHRTRSGALVGTPRYMSPEQCLGEGEVDQRSDIYSLGVIIYEMVCGRPPFVTEGVGALINMHINRPPDPPRQLHPAIPASLEAAILRTLAKRPADRFASMDELLHDLRAVQGGLGEARVALPPRGADVSASAPTPTPLSAMATLMDARPATLRSSPPPTDLPARARTPISARRWVFTAIGLVELGAAVILFVVLRPDRTASPPRASAPVAVAPVPAIVSPPVHAPAKPAPVSIDSDPAGATVSAAGKTLGTTPFSWDAPTPAETTELQFALEGYRRETILAVPTPGLKLRPRLRRVFTRKGITADGAAAPASFDDIKSER